LIELKTIKAQMKNTNEQL